MKRQISISLTEDVLRALDVLARQENRSRSNMAAILIEQWLDELRQKEVLDSECHELNGHSI